MSQGKTPVARPRHTRGDNIKTDPKQIRCESADWIQMASKEYSGGLLWTRNKD
jgi:hypothetical protein